MKWDYNTLSNGSQIEIHNLKKVNLKGGILIDGFYSVGLINSTLSMCFMNPVPNDPVSVMDSPLFQSISMVHDAIADFPTRITSEITQGYNVIVQKSDLFGLIRIH